MPKECANNLQILLDTCAELGIPVAAYKSTDPTTHLAFLGILIDTIKMQIRLPQKKLEQLRDCCRNKKKKCYTRRELVINWSLAVQHAAKAVCPDRFVTGMLSLLRVATKLYHHIRLNKDFRADVWWRTFVSPWNGVSMLGEIMAPSLIEYDSPSHLSYGDTTFEADDNPSMAQIM